jgi:signal peptidase II
LATGEVIVSRPKGRAAAFMRAGAVVVAVLALDQLTKHFVRSDIAVGQVNKILPGLNFVHVRNTGVAFGVFSGGGALVLVFTFAALALLLWYFARHPERPWLWLPAGLLTGGAIGNLLDRLINGAVTDFIKLPLWPAFNVADMAITFGVLALIYVIEGRRRDDR